MNKVSAGAVLFLAIALHGCGARGGHSEAPYVPLADVEASYGRLISVGNYPTPDQNGTGGRLGLFKDARGTLWGLPLIVAGDGRVLVWGPPGDLAVTDTIPGSSTIVGATNEPTGWRGGTGPLELMLRDSRGAVRRYMVKGSHLAAAPREFYYYRLAPDSQ